MIERMESLESAVKVKQEEHEGLFRICLLCAAISLLVPVWLPKILPLTDYPVHLALIQVSGFSSDLLPEVSNRFETQWFTPYSTSFVMAKILSAFVPVSTNGKILLSLYLLLTPLTFMRLCKHLGKPAYLGLPVILLLYNFNFSWGFLPFLIAIPVIFESVSQAVRFVHRPSLTNGIRVSACLIFLFFTHLFGLLICLVFCLSPVICSIQKKTKTSLYLAISTLPAITLALLWRVSLQFSAADSFFLNKGIRFAPLSLKFRFFTDYLISGDPTSTYRFILGVLAAVLIVMLLPVKMIRSTHRPDVSPDVRFPEDFVNVKLRLGLVISIWIFYLLCPYSWLTAVWLFNRVAFIAAAATLLLLPRKSIISASFIITGITILSLWLSALVTIRHYDYSREAEPGLDILQTIPPGKSLRFMAVNSRTRYSDHNPYEHFGQYYQIYHNSLVFNPFAVLSHMPVRYTGDWMITESRFRPEIIRYKDSFSTDLAADRHDYFLFRVRAVDSEESIRKLFSAQTPDQIDCIVQQNEWQLWAKKEAFDDFRSR